jgi:CRISPR/Cas system CSM-associated protein Csm3 (group 7 of RAMP superfamily)
MKFQNRWKIEGTLKTLTPLRIGDGDSIRAKDRLATTHLKEDTEVNTVATDRNDKPYIPASAIKGNLRAWAEKNSSGLFRKEEIEIIFGSTELRDENAKAGKVQFSNAYIEIGQTLSGCEDLPDWSSERLTAVAVGIAVNRKTRTASDKKLFHQEYVPAGIKCKFEICGNDYAEETLKGDELLRKLLTLLKGFANGVRIGAETTEADKSWGEMKWTLSAIKRSNQASVMQWLEDKNAELLQTLPNWRDLQKEIDDTTITPPPQPTKLSLVLECSDDFLVNDPSKAKTPKEIEANDPHNKKPNHSPLRNQDGKPMLPKSSIKGAIRSQAEKILRTIAVSKNMPENLIKKTIACYPDDIKNACPPIKDIKDKNSLCLACQIFGASGWKSIFSCSDFVGEKTIFVNKKIVAGEGENF